MFGKLVENLGQLHAPQEEMASIKCKGEKWVQELYLYTCIH